jgi:hypothetical protein
MLRKRGQILGKSILSDVQLHQNQYTNDSYLIMRTTKKLLTALSM